MLFPSMWNLEAVSKLRATEVFADEAIAFLGELSQVLSKDLRTRAFPDVATFAFFCRKANLLKIKQQYDCQGRLGRGIVFHIAPSNVPVNFAYSLVCGILAGNINIVRVSSKTFQQVQIICENIEKIALSGDYQKITDRIFIVRYSRQSDATTLLSALCDVRVIWGGDATIAQIRQSPLPARAFDISFADRYSLCVINADAFCRAENPQSIVDGFYNDTYLFDQNACTAPHLVAWMGDERNIETAKNVFWQMLEQSVKQKYHEIEAVIAVDKLTTLYSEAINIAGIKKLPSQDNLLWRIDIEQLPEEIDEFRCSCGYFAECNILNLNELLSIINRKYQTLSYYGFPPEIFADFIKNNSPSGIDRIVPLGHTMDFSLTWDGYDLIETLSRKITVV